MATAPTKVTFHYIKVPNFSEHPLHGVYGGITPHGISMALFSERPVIPQELDAELVPVEGEPGTMTLRDVAKRGKEGAVRSVHAVYHFDIDLAESMIGWLQEKVVQAKKAGLK
ncbi:hypothetical protein [Sphingomonas sp.]|uniref:hypothetical protein n=1 Tax=Sphingomonas sp. TaxID=28214 RepID=UPI0038A25E13